MLYHSKRRFLVTKSQLLSNVAHIIKCLQQPTPFENSVLGRHWDEASLRKNPYLSSKIAQNFTTRSAAVMELNVRGWFHMTGDYLTLKNLRYIAPGRVFNLDATAFYLSPKGESITIKWGDRAVYKFTQNYEKECLTVLSDLNTAGQLAPPMIVFPYERLSYDIVQNVPKGWSIAKSDTGRMKADSYFEYIANVFKPWLTKNNIERPVVLFADGHFSYFTFHVAKFCMEHGIELIILLPNTIHLLQPLDVGFFRVLKNSWRKVLANWRLENQRKLRRKDFGPLLKKAVDALNLPELMESAFPATGLGPFSADGLDFNKLMQKVKDVPSTAENKEDKTRNTLLEDVEKFMDNEVLAEFKEFWEVESWLNDIRNSGLFTLSERIIKASCKNV